jgi:hypothetical protein
MTNTESNVPGDTENTEIESDLTAGDEARIEAFGVSERVSDEPQDGDEEETWSNQSRDNDSDEDDFEEDDEASDGDDDQSTPPRKKIETGIDVLTEELPFRAEKAAGRLKPFLSARVVFELSNSDRRFLFDWTDNGPVVSDVAKETHLLLEGEAPGKDGEIQVDTVITLSERSVMSIRSGDLNPQVGMLTDKIRIVGKVSPAVYIFNVIAPRSRP